MFLILLFVLAAEGTPIRIEPKEVTINQGGDLDLFCDNGTSVKWVHYPQIPIHEHLIYANDTLLDTRYRVHSDRLTIRNVNALDKGDYLCVNDTDILEFYSVFVLADFPGTITTWYANLRLGETFNMTCESDFPLYDHVTLWHFKSVASHNNRYSTLLYNYYVDRYYYTSHPRLRMRQTKSAYRISIANVTMCDAGVYSCNIISSNPSADIYHLSIVPSSNGTCRSTAPTSPGESLVKREYRRRKTGRQ